MVRVAITGAAGRMGRSLIQACQNDHLTVTVALEQKGHASIGMDAGLLAGMEANNVIVSDNIEEKSNDFDVLIDFTIPASTVENLKYCVAHQKKIIIGTTGFSPEQKVMITGAASDTGVVFAPNMSIGVNLCFKLLALASQTLGDDVDIEIIEAHHKYKKDAPSGTAVRMGEIIAEQLGRELKDCAVYGRQGITGERDRQTIGFETIRAGDIVGDHTVMFASEGERVEITHKASSRMTFANGAAKAAAWVMQYDRGLFDMQDVLGLE